MSDTRHYRNTELINAHVELIEFPPFMWNLEDHVSEIVVPRERAMAYRNSITGSGLLAGIGC